MNKNGKFKLKCQIYILFPFCRVVMLQSKIIKPDTPEGDDGHDLYIVAGHEASY